MSKYTDLAMERRSQFSPEGRPAWNCCQAVVTVFAQDAGFDEEASMKAATYFRGGMQIGSVCGAVTGSLLALGLAGVDDPQVSNDLIRQIRENHDGMINCRDLLRVNAENGGEKMPHCNSMIRECIELVENALKARGKLGSDKEI
jgi:C_GCAxxG_C_C family probable redox protein